jgi:hypothetical protein
MQVHGYELMLEAQHPLARGDVAAHWYSTVFLPTVELVAGKVLDGQCRHATDADRFLWLWEQRPGLSAEHGSGRLAEVVRAGTSDGTGRNRRGGRRARRARARRRG